MQHNTTNGRTGRRTYLKAMNTRVLMTLAIALTVILAGCVGGLGGSDGGAGVAEAETPGDGADGAGGDETNGVNGGGSGDGADENPDSEDNELAKTNLQPREEDWFNATENGYEFEIVDSENGTGTASFKPPADPTETLYPTVTYEGDESFKQAYTGREDALGDPTGPVLQPLATGGFFGLLVDDEDLAVGYENSTTSNGSTVTTKITGMKSYAGVECYATEITADGEPVIETCLVPYTEDAYASDYPPYVAIYDGETGDLRIEVTLTEIRKG